MAYELGYSPFSLEFYNLTPREFFGFVEAHNAKQENLIALIRNHSYSIYCLISGEKFKYEDLFPIRNNGVKKESSENKQIKSSNGFLEGEALHQSVSLLASMFQK